MHRICNTQGIDQPVQFRTQLCGRTCDGTLSQIAGDPRPDLFKGQEPDVALILLHPSERAIEGFAFPHHEN
jgi:hypothetical protein